MGLRCAILQARCAGAALASDEKAADFTRHCSRRCPPSIDLTTSASSVSSLSVLLSFSREYSSISRPWMILYEPPLHSHGAAKTMPLGIPYEHRRAEHYGDQSSEPRTQSRTWSIAALAAEAAPTTGRAQLR